MNQATIGWSDIAARQRRSAIERGADVGALWLMFVMPIYLTIAVTTDTYRTVVPLGVAVALTALVVIVCVVTLVERGGARRSMSALFARIAAVVIGSAAVVCMPSAGVTWTDIGDRVGYIPGALTILNCGYAILIPSSRLAGWATMGSVGLVFVGSHAIGGGLALDDPVFLTEMAMLLGGYALAASLFEANVVALSDRNDALRRIAEMATHDALTGVLNRRALTEQLAQEIARADRHRMPLGVAIVDIDNFKRLNTVYGHAVGDRMLQEVAATIDQILSLGAFRRHGGFVARYGGEEFVIVLPGADAIAVERLAEEVRAAIAARRVRVDQRSISVTISAGWAWRSAQGDEGVTELLGRADAALYVAKESGRNCVRAAKGSEQLPPPESKISAFEPGRHLTPTTAEDGAGVVAHQVAFHRLTIRWSLLVAAVLVLAFGLLDFAIASGPFPAFPLEWAFVGRAVIGVLAAALCLLFIRFPPGRVVLCSTHAGLIVASYAAMYALMTYSGGLRSPYAIGLTYAAIGWSLALSARAYESVLLAVGLVLSVPAYAVFGLGVEPFGSDGVLLMASVATSGFVAGAVQQVFARLRKREYLLREELAYLARVDPLTGLPNRPAFEARFERERERASGPGALAVSMFDLDHFKRLNDSLGHLVGDEVLVQIAEAVHDKLREHDMVARIGGEEFALLLPHTDGDAAVQVSERMRETIEGLDLDGRGLRITASFGVSVWRGADDGLRDVMERADAAMRRAKAAGRNRVARFDEEAGASTASDVISAPTVH